MMVVFVFVFVNIYNKVKQELITCSTKLMQPQVTVASKWASKSPFKYDHGRQERLSVCEWTEIFGTIAQGVFLPTSNLSGHYTCWYQVSTNLLNTKYTHTQHFANCSFQYNCLKSHIWICQKDGIWAHPCKVFLVFLFLQAVWGTG